MIALVSGTVAVRRGDHVVVDCGGVGYRLSVSAETLRHVPAVGELLEEHAAEALAVEELYFGANVRTAFAVGQARGVILLAAGQRGVPSRSYTPQQVKGAVCGSGRADKGQVARMVARLLGLPKPPTPDHAADALAVAICDVNRAPLAQAVARA